MAKHSKKKKRLPETGQVKLVETKESATGKPSGISWPIILPVLVIAIAVLWIYWPALYGDWIWDDPFLIAQNTLIHDPNGLWKIWFEPRLLVDYQPITVSAEWIEWRLWGYDTLGYHVINVVLHVSSAVLIWRLFDKLGLRFAWLGGLIFAIHPMQVESVAWISEIKNMLSLPFFLLAMCAWIDYMERQHKSDYWLALGLFTVAMLCKTTMIMFPVVILLYTWWKRGLIGWSDLKESVSFFTVSLVLGVITLYFSHNDSDGRVVPMGGVDSRLACVGMTIVFYISKILIPVNLMPIYPPWLVDPPSWIQFLPWPLLAGAICWLWMKRESWGRHGLLGVGFFLVNLVPVVGFIAMKYSSMTWSLDHLIYIPILGLIALVVAVVGQLMKKLAAPRQTVGFGIMAVVMALLAIESHSYAQVFISQETLWSYTVAHNPGDCVAHNNLGNAFLETSRVQEAIEQFKQSLRIDPNYANAHLNLGNALAQSGQISEAIEQDRQASKLNPKLAEAYSNIGDILLENGQWSGAIEQYQQALKVNPKLVPAYCNLGLAFLKMGRLPEAIEEYRQAMEINPDDPLVRDNWDKLKALQKTVPITK